MTRFKTHGLFLLWVTSLLSAIISCESVDKPSKEIGYTGQEGTLFDIDSNKYKTIGIGTQIWMAENLKVTNLNNGTPINNVTDSTKWPWGLNPAYCWYNNDSVYNRKIYGGLYNYFAVRTNMLCPVGWHVPTSNDWDTLIEYIGYKDAGKKLKKAGAWNGPTSQATDKYGFSVLPGGYRKLVFVNNNKVGKFIYIKEFAIFWCYADSVESSYYRALSSNYSDINSYSAPGWDGLSVRCICDNPTKR